MAKLPDISDLGPAPVADRARPIADYSAGGQALARGAETLGKGFEQFGAGVGEAAMLANHWEYAKANSWFHSSLIDQEDRTKQDTNYGPDDSGKSLVNRHAEGVWGLRDQAAEMIPSGPMRELFRMRTAPVIARSIEGAREHATTLEHQASAAYVLDAGNDLINKAPNVPDEATRRDAIDGQNQLIDGLATKGAITRVQAAEHKKQFAERYAIGWGLGQTQRDPAGSAKALANPPENSLWSMIPIEHRMTMLRNANHLAGIQHGYSILGDTADEHNVPVAPSPSGGIRPVIDTPKPVQQATEGIISAIDPDTGQDIAPEINAAGEKRKQQQQEQPTGGTVQPAVVGTPATAKSLRSEAYRRALQLPPEQRQAALTTIDQQIRVAEIAAGANEREKKEVSEQAAGGYATEMWTMAHSANKDFVGLAERINHDQNLEWRTKDALLDRMTRLSGGDEELTFGAGYTAARAAAFAGPNDPAHQSLAELANRTDLTTRGLNDIAARLRLAQKDIDRHSVEQRITNRLQEAKQKLSFEEDTGPIKIRDPKGELAYHQFVDEFLKGIDAEMAAAVESGKRDGIDKFLSRENVNAMMREFRKPEDMARDRISAMGGAEPEAANAPLPPVPQGFNDSGWKSLMVNPPVANHAAWGKAIEILASDPSPVMQATFDHTYGVAGYTAKDVLRKLQSGQTPSAPQPSSALPVGP